MDSEKGMDSSDNTGKKSIWNLSKISWKGIGKSQWLILLLVGILLMIIVMPTTEQKETGQKKAGEDAADSGAAGSQWQEYKESIETQLEQVLSKMQGVGKVQVMVTLEGTAELVVEKDIPQTQSNVQEEDSSGGKRTTKESTWEESTIYSEQDGNSTPYVIKELAPDVEGVLVIAEGGDNGTVAKNISEAVQALFPIEVHKIKVVKMK